MYNEISIKARLLFYKTLEIMFDSHTEFYRTPWVHFGVTGGEQWDPEVGENY